MRRFLLLVLIVGQRLILCGQMYTVDSNDDVDDGVCNSIHCSLREAINAAESDGVPSVINFNIPGTGPHIIVPTGVFPNPTDQLHTSSWKEQNQF